MSDLDNVENGDESAIAIVGMACHLPGAFNLKQYWANLRDGVESVRFYTDQELLAVGESAADLADPNYVRAQPFLENFDRFDAKFWGFSPQDAAVTDPAHRLFLEVAYQSLEHAGHTGDDAEGTVGVFAASGASLYWMDHLRTNPQLMAEMGEFLVRHTGNDMNFLATRLSYELDFRGPSVNVQTACSSALVAVHMAVQSLLGGECDTAIVGGSTVLLPQNRGYLYKEGEIMSPDGHCRPFDAKSAGTIFGSGAGSVVLRRLDDALEDGDTVYAVIAGSAINNDGAQKAGYLAPGVEGQAAVIAEALEISGVEAEDVSYVESHGTGTQVGDPIEFEALNQVYCEATSKRAYCRLGSVKANIGHLGEAAGVAAIIKVILALQHKELPPLVNYESPNPAIDLGESPFLINKKLEPWGPINGERLAGITALGAGGTNAHLVLREAPTLDQPEKTQLDKMLLVLSAKTPTALHAASRNLAVALREQPDLELADVAYTLQIGRRAYAHRRALAVADRDDAIALLEGGEPKRIVNAKAEDRTPSLVFMFPGGGAQYAGMGAELYASEPVYRDTFESCLGCLDSQLAEEIRALVLAKGEDVAAASKALERPSRTLPSLFATEYALAKQLLAWGAEPAGFIGHSMGEYTAACLAGVVSLNDAMRMVLLRGQLFEKLPLGGMLSIALPEREVRQYMPANLDIAAVNAPDLCVASGPVSDIEQLQARLEEKEIDCTRVRIEVAAHSAMLDEVLQEYRDFCKTITSSKPQIPYTSNSSGGWITDAEATDPNYWVQHLRNTVKFSDNVATVVANEARVLVEVGPGQTLTNLARAGEQQAHAIFGAMRHPNDQSSDVEVALRTFGHIWAAGVTIDWGSLWADERRRRVALPAYPFERKAYWVEPGVVNAQEPDQAESGLKKRQKIEDWFGLHSWTQTAVPKATEEIDTRWLVFDDELGICEHIDAELGENAQIIRVKPGERFSRESDRGYRMAATNLEQFENLFADLAERDEIPQHIIYLWTTTPSSSYPTSSRDRFESYDQQMESCFWGLFHLAKVLSERIDPVRLTVVSSDMHAINSLSCPEKAALLGPVAVLPHELPHVKTQSIDVSLSTRRADSLEVVARQIVKEMQSVAAERVVAYRGADRWVKRISPVPLTGTTNDPSWVRSGGNYLISGGLGGIGLTVAKYLASLGAGTLALMGRSGFPDRSQWAVWLERHSGDDHTAVRIKQLQEIESLGASVLVLKADVSNFDSVHRAVEEATNKCGAMNGVVHAAGSMDDQLIVLKSDESAKSVMDAKIKGALVLDSIFPADSLDFFVVFSSVASYLGLPGQVDYTAANAFLDAFAEERAQRATGQSVAINWNAWRDVGMAAAVQKGRDTGEDIGAEMMSADHPVLHHYVKSAAKKHLFSTAFSVDEHWLLSEHRVRNGSALIPGTGFVEMIRGAFVDHCAIESGTGELPKGVCVELSGIQFLEAFQVVDEETRSLHIDVEGMENEASLNIYSDSEEMVHVVAKARMVTCDVPAVDVPSIRARCQTPVATRGKYLDQDFVDFGERWGCINRIASGTDEALLDIELSQQFSADLEGYKLHPALLDMAIGGAQFLIGGFRQDQDFYVPVAYQRVVIYADMPRSFVSHVRVRDHETPEFALFDVVMVDDGGNCFAEVAGFTMKKVAAGFAMATGSQVSGQRSTDPLVEILREAISPNEGVEAFGRVMAQNEHAQWIVSSTDLNAWMGRLENPGVDDQGGGRLNYEKEETHDPDVDPDIPEIEKALAANSALAELVVRSYPDQDAGRRLVLYYTIANGETIAMDELFDYCREVLGEDQVPQYCLVLEQMPRTTDGGVNRAELNDPLAVEETYIAPRTDPEKELAEIWQDVLGIKRIGLEEDFFELGGHSLLLIRLVARTNKKFSVNLEVATLFSEPTIERWAELIAASGDAPAPTVKKISRVSRSAHRMPHK